MALRNNLRPYQPHSSYPGPEQDETLNPAAYSHQHDTTHTRLFRHWPRWGDLGSPLRIRYTWQQLEPATSWEPIQCRHETAADDTTNACLHRHLHEHVCALCQHKHTCTDPQGLAQTCSHGQRSHSTGAWRTTDPGCSQPPPPTAAGSGLQGRALLQGGSWGWQQHSSQPVHSEPLLFINSTMICPPVPPPFALELNKAARQQSDNSLEPSLYAVLQLLKLLSSLECYLLQGQKKIFSVAVEDRDEKQKGKRKILK